MPGFTVCGCCYTPDAEDCIRIEKEKVRTNANNYMMAQRRKTHNATKEQEAEIARLKEEIEKALEQSDDMTYYVAGKKDDKLTTICEDAVLEIRKTLQAALNPQKEKKEARE